MGTYMYIYICNNMLTQLCWLMWHMARPSLLAHLFVVGLEFKCEGRGGGGGTLGAVDSVLITDLIICNTPSEL